MTSSLRYLGIVALSAAAMGCSTTGSDVASAGSAASTAAWTSDATATAATAGTAGSAASSGGTSGTSTGGPGTASGATTVGSGGTTGSGTGGASPKFDLGAPPDAAPPDECISCSITIASKQSGALLVTGAGIFGTAELMGEIVYALGTSGAGRFIASADSSLPFNEQTDCPIVPWLAGTDAEPAVLTFGWGPGDGPKSFALPGETVAGIHLPAAYVGNPAQLAADFDIVVYMEGSGQFDGGDQPSDAEMQTVLEYVETYGGGLYVVSEFYGYMKDADLVSVNRLMEPLGVEALPVNLDWGNVQGNIEFACFPAPAG